AKEGAVVGAVDLVDVDEGHSLRDIVVDAADRAHWERIIAALGRLDGVEVIETTDRTFLLHVGGKLEQHNKNPLKTRDDLSMVYTPGVARVCRAIADDPDKAFQYTIKRNTVAVVSDGTAVLGLGNIGPRAAMPVMEGKCCLFKEFAGVDAFPICLQTTDTAEIVRAVELIAPAFGGVNLEDISAPRCFEIEEQLKQMLDIPVFHGDQPALPHGLAGGRARRRGSADRPLRRAGAARRVAVADEPRRDGVRDGQPQPGGGARGGGALRAHRRHRALGLSQPDQQRALL